MSKTKTKSSEVTKPAVEEKVKISKTEQAIIQEAFLTKPVYKFGWLGWFLAKVCITFTRWLADKAFGKFADWVENKLLK